MIKILIKRWLDIPLKPDESVKYCRFFHSAVGKDGLWYCSNCNLTYPKLLSDDELGPM
jgi:hypothetical protein